MSIDVRFKTNTIPGAKADVVETEESANEGAQVVDETEGASTENAGVGDDWDGETWGIEVPGMESEPPESPFDDYMFGDVKGCKAMGVDDPGLMAFLDGFPPLFDEVRQADPRVDMFIDVVHQQYLQAKTDLETYRQMLVNMQNDASLTPEELSLVSQKIVAIDQCLVRIEVEDQKCVAFMGDQDNVYFQELQGGRDLNSDGWIGRPNAPWSYGVMETPNGKIYLSPDGQILDTPPYVMPDYDVQVAKGNVQIVDYAPPEGHPEVDLTLEIIDPQGSNGQFDSSFINESNFNTIYEMMSLEYVWVERETHTSFNPKLEALGDMFESCMSPAQFEAVTDENGINVIHQITPEDRSRYMQVTVARMSVETHLLPNQGGGNHVVTYYDKDDNIIARICYKGFESPDNAAWADAGGNAFASTFGVSINMNNSYTDKIIECDGIISTGRHVVGTGELAGALGIPTSVDDGDEAYDNNINMFEQGNPETTAWNLEPESGYAVDIRRDDADMPTRDASWEYDAYLPPGQAEGKMFEQDLDDDGNRDVWARENFSTLYSGVFIYGQGARGHFIGSNYNDIILVADAHQLENRQEYLDAFPDREPLGRHSPRYVSVVEAGEGYNIVRAHGGDLYAEGVTMFWGDANNNDNIYIKTQGPDTQLSADFDDEGFVQDVPINYWNYVHADSNGGTLDKVHVHNPNEAVADLIAKYSKDAGNQSDWEESPWVQSMLGDYYDINAGTKVFTNLDDRDVINTAGQFSGTPGSPQGMRDWADVAIQELEDEIRLVQPPDPSAQTYADDWTVQYGYTAEMQAEMDDFFQTMFGMTNDLIAEATAGI